MGSRHCSGKILVAAVCVLQETGTGKPHMLEKLDKLHSGTQSKTLSSRRVSPVPSTDKAPMPAGKGKELKGTDPLSQNRQ